MSTRSTPRSRRSCQRLPPPRRAYELDLKVGADSLDAMIGYLRSFETDLYMGKISNGVSGGYSAGSQYTLSIDESITHGSWAEANQRYVDWLDERDRRAADVAS